MKRSLNSLYDDFFSVTSSEKKQVSQEKTVETEKKYPTQETPLNHYILGQDDAINQMHLALKRPSLMDKNYTTILICGPKGTGKHTLIQRFHEHLYVKDFLIKKDPVYIDLNKITNEDTLIQDIYSALQSPHQMVIFENIDLCSLELINIVMDLCDNGILPLKKRYTLQNDKLVLETNHLTKDLISQLKANHHYFILLSNESKTNVSHKLGNQMMNCIQDIIETQPLSKEIILKLIEKDCAIFNDYTIQITNATKEYLSTFYDQIEGYHAIKKVLNKIHHELTTYAFNNKENLFILDYQNQLKLNDTILLQDTSKIDVLSEIQKEMDEIIGLDEVKKYIYSLRDYIAISKRRKMQGLKTDELSLHMIFTGNPGTGKTTMARLIAKYLKALGVLKNGQLIEVTRADLVASYVGQTAPKTKQVIESSLGGVLFIDEAYSLFRGKEDSFGLEAIDMLVKGMEDYRDQFIVVLAGYTKEMSEFLEANSGLKSRFANTIEFPDYTGQQLLDIAISQAAKRQYEIIPSAQAKLLDYFTYTQTLQDKRSGNGRLARNVVEDAILKQASRIANDLNASLTQLIDEDFILE